ncbi:MAG: dihydroneopterin aldolase [Gammaproteobacteria bacterium]|jgi:dihydroneopterin aldolase
MTGAPRRDKVFIRDLTFNAILGILPEERVQPQPVIINLTLITDITVAAASKNIGDTLNYAEVADAARSLTVEGEYLLIETLVEDIAKVCLEAGADAVSVRVEKPNAVSEASAVGVEIYRERI